MEKPLYPKDIPSKDEPTPLQNMLNSLNAELPQELEATEVTQPLNSLGFTGLTGWCSGCHKGIMLPEFASKNNGIIKYYCEVCEKIDPRPKATEQDMIDNA